MEGTISRSVLIRRWVAAQKVVKKESCTKEKLELKNRMIL